MPSPRRPLKQKVILLTAGFLLGIAITFLLAREPTKPLTIELLAVAKSRWNNAAIADYSLRYEMHGSTYTVEVRHGVVELLEVDGRNPQGVELANYHIPGLFLVLDRELENAADVNMKPGDMAVKFRARFNGRLGYPERYVRGETLLGKSTSIKLIEFRRLSPSNQTK